MRLRPSPASSLSLALTLALALAQLLSANPVAADDAGRSLDVLRADVEIRLALDHPGAESHRNELHGAARLRIRNSGDTPLTDLPLLLHRLLSVEAVDVVRESGEVTPLAFRQEIVPLAGWPRFQVRSATATLVAPLPPGGVTTLAIEWSGGLHGVQETGMLYVRESLDPEFTILRNETLFFPQVAAPTEADLHALWRTDAFDWTFSVTAPASHRVANGARLVEVRESPDGTSRTWVYESLLPSAFVAFPVAPYGVLRAGAHQVFHLPGDEDGAGRLARALEEATDWLGERLGPPTRRGGFAVIEIPDGYGSQALWPTILQTAPAFRGGDGLGELYHELSHLWDVESAEPLRSPRWNEGLAMFVQARLAAALDDAPLREAIERLRERARENLAAVPEDERTPMAEYGETGRTGLSYSIGGVFFSLVHRRMGDRAFFAALAEARRRYGETGITTRELTELLAEAGGPDVDRLAGEWIWGTGYVSLVLGPATLDELSARYDSAGGTPGSAASTELGSGPSAIAARKTAP